MITPEIIGRLSGVSLLATGPQPLVLQFNNVDGNGEIALMPQFVYVVLRALTGPALSVSPKFRIGGNVTHDDVCPVFTVGLGVQVGVFALPPLAAFPMVPVNLRNTPVIFEVTQAGVGPTVCSGDVVLVGMGIGS